VIFLNDGVNFLVAKGFFTDRYKKLKNGKKEMMPKCKDFMANRYLNVSCLLDVRSSISY